MKMTPERRAVDKIYRRRDRYEIPDWQRENVWETAKKQRLIEVDPKNWTTIIVKKVREEADARGEFHGTEVERDRVHVQSQGGLGGFEG